MDYVGSFRVSEMIESRFTNRTNAITEIREYDEPHITIYQLADPDNSDPMIMNYVVSILNDGNCTLESVYVHDDLPAGTSLLSSSISASSRGSSYVDWVFDEIPIGHSVTIYLQVRINSVINPSINYVSATASCDGNIISAADDLEASANWLSCSNIGGCSGNSEEWDQSCKDQCI